MPSPTSETSSTSSSSSNANVRNTTAANTNANTNAGSNSVRLPRFAFPSSNRSASRGRMGSHSRSRSRNRLFSGKPSSSGDDYFSLMPGGASGVNSPPIMEDEDEFKDDSSLMDQPRLPSFKNFSDSNIADMDTTDRRNRIREELENDADNVFENNFNRSTGLLDNYSVKNIDPNHNRTESSNTISSDEKEKKGATSTIPRVKFYNSSDDETTEDDDEHHDPRQTRQDRQPRQNLDTQQDQSQHAHADTTQDSGQVSGQDLSQQSEKNVRIESPSKNNFEIEERIQEGSNSNSSTLTSHNGKQDEKSEKNNNNNNNNNNNDSNENPERPQSPQSPQEESFADRMKKKMNLVLSDDPEVPEAIEPDGFFSKLLNLGDIGGLIPGASKSVPKKNEDEEEKAGADVKDDGSIPLQNLSPEELEEQARGLVQQHKLYPQNTGSTTDSSHFYAPNPDYYLRDNESGIFGDNQIDGSSGNVVDAPKRVQEGVLSSLLKLYANPADSRSQNTLVSTDSDLPSKYASPLDRSETNSSEFSKIKSKLKRIGSGIPRSTSQQSLFNSDEENYVKSNTNKNAGHRRLGSLIPGHHSKANFKRSSTDNEFENMPSFSTTRPKQNKRSHILKAKREATKAKITVHIAAILQRQRFILRMCKALMLYGAPTHRLEEYMVMTARVLEIDGQFIYFPGCMLVSFGDASTRTSEVQLVRCSQGLDLSRLHDVHKIYKAVVHDLMGVEEANAKIDDLLSRKPLYPPWVCVFIYGFSSAMVASWGFSGGWRDMPICFGIGTCVALIQFYVSTRSSLYSSVFEVTASIVVSFLGRAIGSIKGGDLFCFGSIVQSSLALILPGYIILCGSLELQSRNIVAGSVRMFYAIIYSLFLGFGITLGAALYGWLDESATSDTTCTQITQISPWFRFLFVPLFAIGLALINQARLSQLPVMVVIAGGGYVVTYFAGKHFSDATEFTSAMGAFVIGILGNLYSRVGRGMAVAAMLPAIFVQVPSGIASQSSLLSGVETANDLVGNDTSSSSSSSSGTSLSFGVTMVEVSIGISVGLFAAAIVVYPFGKKSTGLFTL
ncbi:hypothetical protein PACTADRAFT_51686 [Pachysolen tannophilus NRRL Y-2460]|uniref:Pheromone-regulated membrane protein 10 n=1 Tax=Pachysolen tannophilus NRRL Y-2460 TaxID=669874 RepID=A0A1E4TQB4_PACTA|nr:hypothetical protein PACTADRAFT_51686 [Pachysolen tannophilus NRRL Y-2460]